MKHDLQGRIFRYLFVGSLVALFQVTSFAVFFDLLHWHYQTSAVLAFVLTVAVSFEAQRRITYAPGEVGRRNTLPLSGSLFLLNTGAGLLLVSGIMYLGVTVFSLNEYFTQVVALGILAVCNFFIFHVVFR